MLLPILIKPPFYLLKNKILIHHPELVSRLHIIKTDSYNEILKQVQNDE